MLNEGTRREAIVYIKGILTPLLSNSSSTSPPATSIGSNVKQDLLRPMGKKMDGLAQSILILSKHLDAYIEDTICSLGLKAQHCISCPYHHCTRISSNLCDVH